MASTTCYAPGPPGWLPRRPAEASRTGSGLRRAGRDCALAAPAARRGRAAGPGPRSGVPARRRPGQAGRSPVPGHPQHSGRHDRRASCRTRGRSLAQAGRGRARPICSPSPSLPSTPSATSTATLSRERVDAVLRTHDELSAFLERAAQATGRAPLDRADLRSRAHPHAGGEQRLRVQGGTITTDELIPRVNRALDEALGARQDGWVAASKGIGSRCAPPFPARAIDVAVEVLRREPGLFRVVRRPRWTRRSHSSGTPGFGAERAHPPGGETALDAEAARPRRHSRVIWNDDTLVPLMVEAAEFRLRRDPQVPRHAGSAHHRGAPRKPRRPRPPSIPQRSSTADHRRAGPHPALAPHSFDAFAETVFSWTVSVPGQGANAPTTDRIDARGIGRAGGVRPGRSPWSRGSP